VSDAAVLYAAALSASRLKQHNQGLALAQRLLAQPGLDEPARRAASLLALEIWLSPGADGAPSAAQASPASTPGRAWLNGLPALAAQALAGADRASVLLGAQAAIRQGQPAQASQRLQVWVAEHAADALAWQTLAQAWSTQGQPLRAIRAEAESRVAQLDVDGAVDRLRSARELGAAKGGAAAADHLELSIIDARYRQLAQRQRELLLEQKP
jgi:predicted Zn-dependent protease